MMVVRVTGQDRSHVDYRCRRGHRHRPPSHPGSNFVHCGRAAAGEALQAINFGERVIFSRNVQITLIDETGELYPVQFRVGVPADVLLEYLKELSLIVNGPTQALTDYQQALLADMRAGFNDIKASGKTLVFLARDFGRFGTEIMGLSRTQDANGFSRPLFHGPNGSEIWMYVNTRQINTSTRFPERRTIMIHELLHLSPTYELRSQQTYAGRNPGPINVDFYNEWHNRRFNEDARIIVRVLQNEPLPTERTTVEGTPAPDSLYANNPVGNELVGYEGDDHLRAEGELNSLHGGPGVDHYHLGINTGQGYIVDVSDGNIIHVDPPYTAAHLRVETIGTATYIAIDPTGSPNSVATDLPNYMAVGTERTGFGVSGVEAGGQWLDIGGLAAMAVSRPEFTGDLAVEVRAPFPGGGVAAVPAQDLNENVITLSVLSVSGYASDRQWWFENGWLRTNATWSGNSAETQLTIRASNGRVWQDEQFTVLWKPDPSQPEL